jgi:hypothetical protein
MLGRMPLRRSLACTNSIENILGTVGACRNAKRWRRNDRAALDRGRHADNLDIGLDLLGRAGVGETLRKLICEVERSAPTMLADAAAEIAPTIRSRRSRRPRAFPDRASTSPALLDHGLRMMLDAVDHGRRDDRRD